jgi:hypothetical protein
MTAGLWRRICAALCLIPVLALSPALAGDPVLLVETAGPPLGQLPFPQGQEICLHWNHSVTGGPVADCFENDDGSLTLTRSYLHDFAAGLGDMAGRGTLTPAGDGGYWITDIGEKIPGNALSLRVGPENVNHRLLAGDDTLPLSALAPDTAVLLSLEHR